MAKLSVEIKDGTAEQKEANVLVEGSGQDLLSCLGYLVHTVASDMGIPVPVLPAVVAAGSGKIQKSILELQKLDLGAIEAAMEGGRGK